MLESKGLIEIQHSSPTEFRAVSLNEATETLRDQYENRVHQLHTSLDAIEGDASDDDDATPQQVWSLTGASAIENRNEELIDTASNEVVIVLCDEAVVTENLIATLNAIDDGIELLVGAVTDAIRDRIQTEVPAATAFTSGLEWLRGEEAHPNTTALGRLLLVDRSTLLVSSIKPDSGSEQAVFGEGFTNGLVVIARRIMAAGLLEPRSSRA